MQDDVDQRKPKDRILYAAKELFDADGYVSTSVRAIATRAVVDPTLVVRHFGSKELLFLEAMTINDEKIRKGLGFTRDEVGEHIVRFIFCDADNIKNVYVELVRASGSDAVTEQIKEVLKKYFEEPIYTLLDGQYKEARSGLIVAMMMGLMDSLWILKDERLIHLDIDVAVALYGTTVQSIVDRTWAS